MKVLVAIDNRPSAQATLDALVKMNWYEGTEIILLTVFPSNSEVDEAAYYEELENVAVEVRNHLRHCKVSFLARHGDPQEVIIDFAQQVHANLIMVGSNCKNSLERIIIGSVSQAILNSAQCPVIVAKTPCSFAHAEEPVFKNVLLPIDNSVFSVAAVRWLTNFRWTADTKLVVLAVVEQDTDLDQVHNSLNNRAGELARYFRSGNILTEIVRGEPQQTIIDVAHRYHSDLIVMGSHGHTGFKKLILGSVSQAVSHQAPCAVAIVRGLARSDQTMKRTGAFDKKRVLKSSGHGNGFGSSTSSVHLMPGGF